jgi:hypothetical protein
VTPVLLEVVINISEEQEHVPSIYRVKDGGSTMSLPKNIQPETSKFSAFHKNKPNEYDTTTRTVLNIKDIMALSRVLVNKLLALTLSHLSTVFLFTPLFYRVLKSPVLLLQKRTCGNIICQFQTVLRMAHYA